MAQRLRSSDSPEKCSNSTNRHERICAQNQGTEFLISNVRPAREQLDQKILERDAARKVMEQSYDLWVYTDGGLDIVIRNAASRCREFDRENPGVNLFSTILPKGIEAVTGMKREDEPDEADNVAVRIEKLGSEHPVFPNAAKIRQEAQKSRDAYNTYKDALKKLSTAEVEVDIAKSNLINKYLENILEAEKAFGRQYANRLFPTIRSGGSGPDDNGGSDNNNPGNNSNGKDQDVTKPAV